MHPENIRKILEDGGAKDRQHRLERGSDEYTVGQLHSAWRTILWLWDNVPDAKKQLGG